MAASKSHLIPRLSAKRITDALKDTPVVMVTGPRQSGKTTLVRQFVGGDRRYVTLDDDVTSCRIRLDVDLNAGDFL